MAQAQRIIKGTSRADVGQSQDLLGDMSGISAGDESSVSVPIHDSKRKNSRRTSSGPRKSSVLLHKSLLESEVEAEIERQTAHTAQQVKYRIPLIVALGALTNF